MDQEEWEALSTDEKKQAFGTYLNEKLGMEAKFLEGDYVGDIERFELPEYPVGQPY